MRLTSHYVTWSRQDRQEALDAGMDPGLLAYVRPASGQAVQEVLKASEEDPDGRSNWVWVSLPNGDLILGVYPQGDTYLATEHDHARGLFGCNDCGFSSDTYRDWEAHVLDRHPESALEGEPR